MGSAFFWNYCIFLIVCRRKSEKEYINLKIMGENDFYLFYFYIDDKKQMVFLAAAHFIIVDRSEYQNLHRKQ